MMQPIDPATFTRLDEIDAYAKRAGCDRAEAMRQLVNMSLSLLCYECKLDIGVRTHGGMCPRCFNGLRKAALEDLNRHPDIMNGKTIRRWLEKGTTK